jgi:DNA-binding PadR family transcriptional regulator
MSSNWPGADWPFGGFGERDDRYRRPRRSPSGPPPWLQEIFGFVSPPPPPTRGPRVKRGDVRTAIVDVLHRAAESGESINGYQVIQQIADLSDDQWRPSPGSVYPTIQQLHDEGLVESDEERGRRTIRLTEEGMQWAEEHRDELAAVWEPFGRDDRRDRPEPWRSADRGPRADLKSEIGQIVTAVWQLVTQGSEHQRAAAVDVLVDTRRRLYGILADGRRD